MDVWVRSQDKELICMISNLKLDTNWSMNESTIFGYDTMHNRYHLGSFKNKETALQVLNDFQKHVNKVQNMLLNRLNHTDTLGNCYEIFQIPEEEDV